MSSLGKIIVGASFLWYFFCRGANALIVKVKGYSFRDVNIINGTVSLNLNFYIKNPLFIGLTLKSIVGDVYVQGIKVGYVNTTIDYYLSGAHTHIVPVVVNLDVAELGSAALLNIQSGDVRTLTIAFDGKIFVGDMNVGVPVNITLDYNDLTK